MNPKHTTIIEDTRRYTEEASEKHLRLRALTARLLWGESESIVQMWKYKLDGPEEFVTGKNHVTVCKPNSEYLDPLDFVVNEKLEKRRKSVAR